jgi:hemoglobin
VQLVQVDPRLKAQFAEIDAPHLVDMLAQQFCELSGGPCRYSGKAMDVIHDGMKITTAQFNALAEDLQQAMTMQGIPNSIQNKLIAKLAPMQRQIVGK